MRKKLRLYAADFRVLLRDPAFIAYIFKCLLGALICYSLYRLFPGHQMSWSIVSVLLVLAPEHGDSIRFAG